MHYVNTAFHFGGNCLLEKGKYIVMNYHIFFLCSILVYNKNEVLQIYCSFSIFFFFLIDNKLIKLAVALKFLTVLSLNSNVF